MADKLIH